MKAGNQIPFIGVKMPSKDGIAGSSGNNKLEFKPL
jgi:hypothetical protein